MRIVWDESKRRANLKKHGLDFADAALALAGVTCTFEDARFDYGEQRFITLGLLYDTVVVMAHTETARELRMISMRMPRWPQYASTKNENAAYSGASFSRGIRSPFPQSGLRLTSHGDVPHEQSLYFQNL